MRRSTPIRYLFTLVVTVLATAGCTLHTVDSEPEPLVEAAATFSRDSGAEASVGRPWWDEFSDGTLDGLIRDGLDNNFDIMQAIARLDQARALTVQARSARLPQVGLIGESEQTLREGDDREQLNRFGAAFSWEIDVFNRLRAVGIARQREQLARQDDVNALRLRLSAAIATAYFDVIGWRNQLNLLNDQIGVDRDLLELTRMRYDSGVSALVDVLQQSSQLADTESLVPPVEAALRLAENRLDVLLGSAPDGDDRVPETADFIDPAELPFIGVPVDLLQKRPDLRALRNELVAADARIGEAIAARFPRFTLDGSFLYEDGPQGSGAVGSLFGALFQPLLDWGARAAEVERNRALYVERLARYTQAYIEAIEEVENTLYLERKQREFLERLTRRLRFLERTAEESAERYTNGLTDYLPVLDAVKELQRLQRIIVQQERTLLDYRITLHRAVGGALPAGYDAVVNAGHR